MPAPKYIYMQTMQKSIKLFIKRMTRLNYRPLWIR